MNFVLPKINHISPSRKPLNSYRESFEVGWRFLRFAINFYFLFQPSWSYLNSARSSREFDLSGTNFTSKWLVTRYQLIIQLALAFLQLTTQRRVDHLWLQKLISLEIDRISIFLCYVSIFPRPSLLLCTFSNNRSNVNIHKIDAKQRHFLDKDCGVWVIFLILFEM